MPFHFLRMPGRDRPLGRRALQLAVVGVSSLFLGGCLDNLNSLAGFGCKRVRSTVLEVA